MGSPFLRPRTRVGFVSILLIGLIFPTPGLMAQHNVAVDPSTGMAQISIPVYTVARGSLSVPVSLEYSAKGIVIAELESPAGSGWQLNAGGAVTRLVRDLPDDIKADNSSNSRFGWLYNTNEANINSFTISNDNNQATCTDETLDINYIAGFFNPTSDMEPDIFNVQAPGLNCQLVYDQTNQVFRAIPYKDLTVSYTLNAGQTAIIAFQITNDKGIQYTFSTVESVTQTTSTTNVNNIKWFLRGYTLYKNGITYNQKWCLSQITDLNGNYIKFSYVNNVATRNLSAPMIIYPGSTILPDTLYTTTQVSNPQEISNIASFNKLTNLTTSDEIDFTYRTTTDPAGVLLSSISFNNNKQTLTPSFKKVNSLTRDYLASFGETGCSLSGVNYNSNLYQFNYTGINFSGSSTWIADVRFDGSYQDYWGFPDNQADGLSAQVYVYPPNASYPNLERYRLYPVPGYSGTSYTMGGLNRQVDPSITTGTLSQIIYPTGGSTSLTYQPNDYYDVSAAVTNKGGGLRVAQTIDYDGLNVANNIIKNYTYTNPTTGFSSGKILCMPQLAFTIPYSGTATGLAYWQNSTALLANSVSNQDESVIYGTVTVQQTGAGKTVYQYSTPGTFWDASAQPVAGGTADWAPTEVYAGRLQSGGSCPGTGSLINSTYSYPFPPNINYDFERSIPLSTTSYNDAGNIVSQSTYTYQRSYASAIPITALKADINSIAEGYAKYQVFAGTSELSYTVTKTVNDINNTTNSGSQQIATTSKFYYAGTNHKLPTTIEIDNTDGSIDKTYLKYSKDYTYQNDDNYDQPMGSIKALVGLNVNIPIETYHTVTRSGVELTMRAELLKLGSFSSGVASPTTIYLPAQQLKFVSSAGISSFPSSYNNSGTFTSYSGYIPVSNYTAYNYSGGLLSANDNYKNVKSQLVDDVLLKPVATISNANYNEMLYSNFDGIETRYGLTQTGSYYTSSISRTGPQSLTFALGGTLKGSLTLSQNAKNYIYSCWINASTAGQLTIILSNSNGTQFSSQTLAFTTTSGSGWNYYEMKINTNGVSSGFSILVQPSTAINIDDVLFYPEFAEVNTYSFDPSTLLKTSETNTNGVSYYYTYDAYYRLQYVYDQDHNIVQKKSYASANSSIGSSFTSSASSANVGTAFNFTGTCISSSCVPGNYYYSYNFGDGSSTTPSTTGANATHSYTTAGTYTVTITVSNSFLGTSTYSQQVTALMVPAPCQSGVWGYSAPTIYTQACPPNPNNNSNSYYTINSITGLPTGHTVSYQWQIKYLTGGSCGSTSWTNIGSNTSQFVKAFVSSPLCAYNIQCIVTDVTNGQQVTVFVGSLENGDD